MHGYDIGFAKIPKCAKLHVTALHGDPPEASLVRLDTAGYPHEAPPITIAVSSSCFLPLSTKGALSALLRFFNIPNFPDLDNADDGYPRTCHSASYLVIHFDRSNMASPAWSDLLRAAEASGPASFARTTFLHSSHFLGSSIAIHCVCLYNAAPQISSSLHHLQLRLRHSPITRRFQR